MQRPWTWPGLAALLGVALIGSGGACAQGSNVEVRLQQLEGEAEIRRLLDDYMTLLEVRDWDAYVQLFAADGELDIVEGVLKGREAIKNRMANASARMAAAGAGRPQRQSADLLSNIYVKVDGDTAKARSRFTFLSEDEEGSFRVRGSGLYLDDWIREAGAWRIKRRAVSWDLLAGQSAAPAPAPTGTN